MLSCCIKKINSEKRKKDRNFLRKKERNKERKKENKKEIKKKGKKEIGKEKKTHQVFLSIYTRFTNWIFYMPMALFVPPPIFIVHIQFNLLFQFWIHTEVIFVL